MNITDIFDAATGGLTGIKIDIYTCILAAVGINLIVFAIALVSHFLLGESDDAVSSGSMSADETRELNKYMGWEKTERGYNNLNRLRKKYPSRDSEGEA